MPTKDLEIVVKMNPEAGGLTQEEIEVNNALAAAWNTFLQFKDAIGPDDQEEFRQGVHACQRVLMHRVMRRLFPEFWR